DRVAGELWDDQQQCVEVADQRQQTGIERGAFLLLLRVGCKIDDGQLDFNFLFRPVSCFEKIEPRIGNLELSEAAAIARVARGRDRREAGQGVEHRCFAGAARANNSRLQSASPAYSVAYPAASGNPAAAGDKVCPGQ